jgi:hypothetical protein
LLNLTGNAPIGSIEKANDSEPKWLPTSANANNKPYAGTEVESATRSMTPAARYDETGHDYDYANGNTSLP